MNTIVFRMVVSIILIAMPALHAGAQHNHDGSQIHQATLENHNLGYKLIDIRQALKKHGGDQDQTATHHLMIYITDPQGNPVTGAKVGFLIEGPDKENQRVMAMGMDSGYGADISLAAKGKYTIKTKAVVGDKTLIHGFDYNVN